MINALIDILDSGFLAAAGRETGAGGTGVAGAGEAGTEGGVGVAGTTGAVVGGRIWSTISGEKENKNFCFGILRL